MGHLKIGHFVNLRLINAELQKNKSYVSIPMHFIYLLEFKFAEYARAFFRMQKMIEMKTHEERRKFIFWLRPVTFFWFQTIFKSDIKMTFAPQFFFNLCQCYLISYTMTQDHDNILKGQWLFNAFSHSKQSPVK